MKCLDNVAVIFIITHMLGRATRLRPQEVSFCLVGYKAKIVRVLERFSLFLVRIKLAVERCVL